LWFYLDDILYLKEKYSEIQNLVAGSNLPALSGSLPSKLSDAIHLLSLDEISSIPPSVLVASVDTIANNHKLNKLQRGVILEQIIAGGYQLNNIDQVTSLGELVSELDTTVVDYTMLHSLLNTRPDLIQKMSKHVKADVMDKILTNHGVEWAVNAETKFSSLIPASFIRSMDNINFTAASNMKWKRSQALYIVKKYQNNVNRKLTLSDI
uniref:uncharacterized protein LOC104266111 n=1 Tax=Ciona intestinalis TaxID=7719 RepID=UPI000EF51B78